MKRIIENVVRLVQAGKRIYERKWSFLCLFAIAFLGSVAILAEFDLLPNVSAQVESAITAAIETPTPTVAVSELPTKIEIAKLGLTAIITNPSTTKVEILDGELLKGAVRYPTSAKLGEIGNVVLFGHSSYLPIVKNPAYKTFNGIQKLAVGDVVTVYSVGTAYTYRVRSVTKESVDDNKPIPLSISGKQLTFITCNSFATKSDRFVVVADFVESHSVSG